MKKRMTHGEFITLCDNKGIDVEKISRNFVYINDGFDTSNTVDKFNNIILPNHSDTEVPGGVDIRSDWGDVGNSLFDAILSNNRIRAIQIIRSNTGLMLKDSKNIMDDNWGAWTDIAKRSL
jgi:hypothetical protein